MRVWGGGGWTWDRDLMFGAAKKPTKTTVFKYVADGSRGVCVLEELVFANCILLNKMI